MKISHIKHGRLFQRYNVLCFCCSASEKQTDIPHAVDMCYFGDLLVFTERIRTAFVIYCK